MLDVLEHLPDPRAALRNVRRLLAGDGFFLATVPAFRAAWTSHDVLNQHVTRFTKSSIQTLLEGEGFRITDQHYFFHWLWGAKLLLRAYETLSPREPEVPKVPATWINQLLYLFSRLEQETLGRLPMPFGSSLIVVARNASREGSQVPAANEGSGATIPANKA
jgi:SAM-dependent methyltransferase